MVAEHIPGAVEAILLVAEEPLPPELLAELVGSTPFEVEELCADLAEQYAAQGRIDLDREELEALRRDRLSAPGDS